MVSKRRVEQRGGDQHQQRYFSDVYRGEEGGLARFGSGATSSLALTPGLLAQQSGKAGGTVAPLVVVTHASILTAHHQVVAHTGCGFKQKKTPVVHTFSIFSHFLPITMCKHDIFHLHNLLSL